MVRTRQVQALSAAVFTVLASTVAQPSLAEAQNSASQATTPASFEPYWELEILGGGGTSTAGGFRSHAFSQPQVLLPVTNGGGALQVSSWLLPPTNVFPSMNSLAPVAAGPALSVPTRGLLGVRVSRWQRSNLGLELSATFSPGAPAQFSPATLAAIEQTRSSFVAAFGDLFAAYPALYSGASEAATSAVGTTGGGQFEATAALAFAKSSGRLQPYGSIGVGERGWIGAAQTATLRGRYTFLTSTNAEIDETDTVTLRYRGGWAPVAVFSGGVRLMTGRRSGFRLDLSLTTGPDRDVVSADLQPFSRQGPPFGFVFQPETSSTAGPIVFSNTANQPTSLSGPTVLNQTTATGRGWRSSWTLGGGWFLRF